MVRSRGGPGSGGLDGGRRGHGTGAGLFVPKAVARVVGVQRLEVPMQGPVSDATPEVDPGLSGVAVMEPGPHPGVDDLPFEVSNGGVVARCGDRRTAPGGAGDVDV